ncbi:hypothetical protein KL906_001022 [Ogataea polymorpha]|uniref:Uncharacterized protein n=1 Tax=Ogataea polymorpha TaxID=460523 RepID=A0A9P8T1F5_9ASCO|nr:hypothetical protein KL906_001022 [Ogataea polymorpha]KAG7919079.1 hypothetical protein KL927_001208 [Ogataea polymorpha]KAH3662748.1 hypothetical protein OGATHE_004324 [Ogataea polymorpha]
MSHRIRISQNPPLDTLDARLSLVSADSVATSERLLDKLGLPDEDIESFEVEHEARNYEPASQFQSLKPFWYEQKQKDVNTTLDSDSHSFDLGDDVVEDRPILKQPQHRRIASIEEYYVSSHYLQQTPIDATPTSQRTFHFRSESNANDSVRFRPLSPPPSAADAVPDAVAEPLRSPNFIKSHGSTGSGSSLSSLIKSPLKALRGKQSSTPDLQDQGLSQHFHSLENAQEMLSYGLGLRNGDDKSLAQSFIWICKAGAVDTNHRYSFHIDPRKLALRLPVHPQSTIYYEIGRALVHGWGCTKDLGQGLEFLELAASFGSIDAMELAAKITKKQRSKAWNKFAEDARRLANSR